METVQCLQMFRQLPIQVGDTVIIVTTQKGLGDILDILRK